MTTQKQSECAAAYIAEFGTAPRNRDEQDRYGAFRFGYEAGMRAGMVAAHEDMRRFLGEPA